MNYQHSYLSTVFLVALILIISISAYFERKPKVKDQLYGTYGIIRLWIQGILSAIFILVNYLTMGFIVVPLLTLIMVLILVYYIGKTIRYRKEHGFVQKGNGNHV